MAIARYEQTSHVHDEASNNIAAVSAQLTILAVSHKSNGKGVLIGHSYADRR
jgi:hypothetical protein